MLYQPFCKYVKREHLFEGCSRLLIALSGGVDSVVLTDLMCRYAAQHEGLQLGLVHCNFHLRGQESDRDESFVREFAARRNLPLHTASFDTTEYAAAHKISIEMAARELRYAYFARLMKEEKYDACLLAHHADDNAETFFINLFRGSGVKGLRGMLPRSAGLQTREQHRGAGLRPLLFARRSQILEYASEHGLQFVEDSTNSEQIYLRNKIRHTVIPLMEQVSEGFTEKLTQSMESMRRVDMLLDQWYNEQEGRVEEKSPDGAYIPAENLSSLGLHAELFLELYLRKRSFSRAQIEQILENYRNGISGKRFENIDGTAVFIREPKGWRCITHTENGPPGPFSSDEKAPPHTRREAYFADKTQIPVSPRTACLNYEKLRFPLTWRHPAPGDKFMPLGTKGFKKLSDFFKDGKVPVSERRNAWLLCSGNDIVWIAGHRLDNRYKLDFSKNASPLRAWVVELV